MTTPWSVPRDWPGETVAVLAGGPSMTREQAEMCRGKCRVIAVNNTAIDTVDSQTKVLIPAFAPWADVLYASDLKWWNHYSDRALKFKGLKVCLVDRRKHPEIKSLQRSDERGFDPRPTHLVFGGNSGYQAVHLAAHFGVKRILLCGFDMKEGPRGRRHWFGAHPGRLNSRNAFSPWIRAFDWLAKALEERNVEVINCSPSTALKCFKRQSLEAALGS